MTTVCNCHGMVYLDCPNYYRNKQKTDPRPDLSAARQWRERNKHIPIGPGTFGPWPNGGKPVDIDEMLAAYHAEQSRAEQERIVELKQQVEQLCRDVKAAQKDYSNTVKQLRELRNWVQLYLDWTGPQRLSRKAFDRKYPQHKGDNSSVISQFIQGALAAALRNSRVGRGE